MAREIVYSQTGPGVFEVRPTLAQQRQAQKKREQRSEMILAILLWSFIGLAMTIIVGANIAAFGGWL